MIIFPCSDSYNSSKKKHLLELFCELPVRIPYYTKEADPFPGTLAYFSTFTVQQLHGLANELAPWVVTIRDSLNINLGTN